MDKVVNAGSRLDRLPIGQFHRRVLWLVALGMFFDSFDNTLSGSILAAMLKSHWSTLELNSLFMSSTFVGLTIGAALAGWLSDHFGRRFAYQFNLAVFGTLAFVSAFAPSMPWLIGLRGLMGLGMGAEYVMGYGLIVEFIPPGYRGRYLGLLGLIAGIGVFVTSVVSVFVIPWFGWRAMFVIGGAGTLWVWWLRRNLAESPRWLERAGHHLEAERVLQGIEQESGTGNIPTPVVEMPVSAARRIPTSVLFSRPVIGRTFLAVIVNITCLFGSYSLTGWMPTFFVSEGMSVTHSLSFNAATMAGFVAGPLICVYVADRIGRRWGVVVVGVVCACLGAIYPLLTSPVAIIGFGFLLVSCVAMFLTLGLGGTPELFPTEYRFRASGLAQTVGRASLIASPFVILWLFEHYHIAGVVVALSVVYLAVAALMALLGFETNRRSLEDIEPRSMLDACTPSSVVASRQATLQKRSS
jgi:putative MFS transporter